MSTRIPVGREFALVDALDADSIARFTWRTRPNHSGSFYAVRTYRENGKRGTEFMHRRILGLKTGDPRRTDHINHDTLDNRRENLRVVTCQQNQWNTRIRRDNKSGYKGVCRFRNKWRAQIRLNGHPVYLGTFSDVKDAAKAYADVAKASFGEFLCL